MRIAIRRTPVVSESDGKRAQNADTRNHPEVRGDRKLHADDDADHDWRCDRPNPARARGKAKAN